MPEPDVLPARPYPGLRPFEKDEWAIFFGREEHADEVTTRLARHGLVLVHGASGCGKSSLIRAGVLPSLETDHEIDGRIWRTATMRPSEGLLRRLAEVLEEALPRAAAAAAAKTARAERDADAEETDEDGEPLATWAQLVVKGGALVDDIEEALQAAGGGSLCLLVDQFEEIFRWARERSDAEARLFIDFLKRVRPSADGGLHFCVILTMRSDYLGRCATYDGFAEFLNQRQYLLPKMDEFGLLRAIQEPAELYGGTVEQALATQLLPVVAGELDGLPVLQHALMRAYEHARPRFGPDEPWTITADDLTAVGGASNALGQHAEEVLARATGGDRALIEAAEWIFRALTDLDADRQAIRRPCSLGELIGVSGVGREATLRIINPFRAPDCVFICPYLPAEIDDDSELDISHEALIRQWPRLSDRGIDPATSRPNGWIFREFQDGLVWRLLAVQGAAFARDKNNLLSAGMTEQHLPFFEAIEKRPRWAQRHALLEERDQAAAANKQWKNVDAMMAASERNLERERDQLWRLTLTRNIGSIILLVAIVIAVGAFHFYSDAKANFDDARQKRATAEKNAKSSKEQLKSAADILGSMQKALKDGSCDKACLEDSVEELSEQVNFVMPAE